MTAYPETIHPVGATKSNSRITAHPECWRALALVCPHAIESTAAHHLVGFSHTGPQSFSHSLLPTNLPLLSRRLQLPISTGVDLLLTPGEHVLRRIVLPLRLHAFAPLS